MRAKTLATAVLVLLTLPSGAGAHEAGSSVAAAGNSEPCPGEPIDPDRVIRGQFHSERQGSYVFLPFKVPSGMTALRVKYCYDQPENAPSASPERHTLDLGLYEPREDASRPWGIPEFRGWGGSSHPDVTLSPQGYSSKQKYEQDPDGHVPGRTTRAFEPGPIPRGRWAVELGLASIVSEARGDRDGRVAYRVEIDWTDKRSFADDPYRPARYDERPADPDPGWYAGDFHVHAEHSALGDATMSDTFNYAFGSLEEGKAGLDFITLSDYVSGTSWDEIGRYQERYPDNLIVRSAEVITYRGHANSHANTAVVDYRTGPLYVRRKDGGLERVRGPRPASTIFDRVHAAGGFTQINHPTIFPSFVPPFASLCRGCPWDYSDAQTDYSKVDAIEIATGPSDLEQAPGQPGPNPFTVTAIEFWEDALAEGHKIAAVGSSDSHNAGHPEDPITQAPIGEATTVVYAEELSEQGIEEGVEAGHTYVKVTGNDGPDLRFRARVPGSRGEPAIMGDTVRGDRALFRARVLGAGPASVAGDPGPSVAGDPDPYELIVMRNGKPFLAAPVTSNDFKFDFPAAAHGRYRLQLQRSTTIETVSSPIYFQAAERGDEPDGGDGPGDDGDRPDEPGGPDGEKEGGNGGAGEMGDDGAASGGQGPDGAVGASREVVAASASGAGTGERGAGGGRLPFTGLALILLAGLGAGLVACGTLIRRRARHRAADTSS